MQARKRAWLGALCMGLASLVLCAPAQGAQSNPLFVFVPSPPEPPTPLNPPPRGYLEGPCGLGVDSSGNFHVSDYYHDAVDTYSGTASYSGPKVTGDTGFIGQLTGVDPLDGPCALAFGSSGETYVNDFHRAVIRFLLGAATPIAGAGVDETHPTGVAVDPSTGRVYVDDRAYVAVYDSSGAPVEEGGEPVRIGAGTLGDGYGVAISRFASTEGYLYVPDAATNTVKVYDPAADKVNPVQTIKAPGKGFVSLRDGAVAVDRVTGNVYVADDLQPAFTEAPQAQIDVFNSTGSFLGVLKYRVTDALPPGLAVDNSATSTQGRVYVTSGNTDQAGIYAYGPGAQTTGSLPPTVGLSVRAGGTGEGQVTSDLGQIECSASCEAQIRSGAEVTLSATPEPGSAFVGWSGGGCEGTSPTCSVAMEEARSLAASFAARPSSSSQPGGAAQASGVAQEGVVRLSVSGKLSPTRLPREGQAPISVSVGWSIATTDGSAAPTLKKLAIEINRHGHFDYAGLPICPVAKIQPASSARALSSCRSSLVGKGTFSADVALRGQEAYETKGRLLVFNGMQAKKPVLLGQIYSSHPFATSFVIPFAVRKLSRGAYGTALEATLPKSLAAWGNLTGIQMTLSRRYFSEGKRHSYLSAGCPAPKGVGQAIFPLSRASFVFKGGTELSSVLSDTCRVRG